VQLKKALKMTYKRAKDRETVNASKNAQEEDQTSGKKANKFQVSKALVEQGFDHEKLSI